MARLLSHDTKEQWLIVPQEFLHWLCSWEWLGDLRGPMRSPHQLLQLLKTKEWISVNYVFLKLSRPTVVCINAKCIHLSLSNVSKNSYIFSSMRSFLTILPKNILLQEFKLFLLHKKRNFAHSVLFDYLSPYSSAVFHDFYFQRDFLLCYCTTLCTKSKLFPLKNWIFPSSLKKRRRKPFSLFLKATIHFDSSRTSINE